MGATRGDFIKYPRTPHLFGSKGTEDDKHLSERESVAFIANDSLIVEEKIDGTNVGIHFTEDEQLILQCRGHLITEGMHPQYDLFKQWSQVRRNVLYDRLQNRYILFGEWLYAKHTVHYRGLSHYFFEFDIYDKATQKFLILEERMKLLDGSGIQTVPVLHRGKISRDNLDKLIGPSLFDSVFDNPRTGQTDNLMEGLYLRIEDAEGVIGRAKMVRPEFVEKITQSTHWQQQIMVPNQLCQSVDIWT